MRQSLNSFKSFSYAEMPEIFNERTISEQVIEQDDSLIVEFFLQEKKPLTEILDCLEDSNSIFILYHSKPLDKFPKETACAYSFPNAKNIFKINIVADEGEMSSKISVTIFKSIEVLYEEIKSELKRETKKISAPNFYFKRDQTAILGDFVK